MYTLMYARTTRACNLLALVFSFYFFYSYVYCIYERIENQVFCEYLSKNIIFRFSSYDNWGLFFGHRSPVFCFRYRIQKYVTVGHAGYMQYISTHMQTWRQRSLRQRCRLYSVYMRNSFFTRATRQRRNSKCVTRLFQWTTLLSEMYTRKTVKVGNIVQCIRVATYMHLSWRFYSRT